MSFFKRLFGKKVKAAPSRPVAAKPAAPAPAPKPAPKPAQVRQSQGVNDHLKFTEFKELAKWEGLRLEAYMPTPNDVWTIGYGHTKTARPGMRITEAQAMELAMGDLKWSSDAVKKRVKVPLNQDQFDALVLFVYNIGEKGFSESSVLRNVNKGDFKAAEKSFMLWNKQRSKKTGKLEVLRGLTNRRAAEVDLFNGDDEDESKK